MARSPAIASSTSPTMLDDLRSLVEVESPSHDIAAIAASAAAVADVIERRLGSPRRAGRRARPARTCTLARRRSSEGADRRPPRHRVPASARWPPGRSPSPTAGPPGPGVFDMKGGIVLAIHARRRCSTTVDGVELLITADEEVGSAASRALIEERALACGAVLVLEPSGRRRRAEDGRKGTGTFEVVVHGRAAHAGLEPEKGDQRARRGGAPAARRIAAFGRPEHGHDGHADRRHRRHRRQRRAGARPGCASTSASTSSRREASGSST